MPESLSLPTGRTRNCEYTCEGKYLTCQVYAQRKNDWGNILSRLILVFIVGNYLHELKTQGSLCVFEGSACRALASKTLRLLGLAHIYVSAESLHKGGAVEAISKLFYHAP